MKTPRPLVESYARSWPREAIALVNNRHSRQDATLTEALALFEKPGVYVLYQSETVYYIGKATNLSKRLRTHMRPGGRYSDHWTHISVFAIPDEAHRNAVESILIASVPTRNGAKPRIKRVPLPAKALKKSQQSK